MGVGRGGVEFEIEQEKVVFFVLSGKKRISPLLAPSGNILEKSLSAPPWKKSFRCPWTELEHATTLEGSTAGENRHKRWWPHDFFRPH